MAAGHWNPLRGWRALSALLVIGSNWQSCIANAGPVPYEEYLEAGRTVYETVEINRVIKRAGPYNLRLLPVGDSITVGVGSTDDNGYRLKLRNLITAAGHTVDFIGSESKGLNNPDNQHEGFGANYINDIMAHMQTDNILRQQPNLVLIHAGTNDNDFQRNNQELINDAAKRLGTMIDMVNCACPNAVVLVALLIQNNFNNGGGQRQTDYFNGQLPQIVGDRYKRGYKVRLMDQSGIGGPLLNDSLHPNDQGYQAMAQNWMDAIDNLPGDWIVPPASGSSIGRYSETCQRGSTIWTSAQGGNNVAAGAHVKDDPGEPLSSTTSSTRFVPQWGDRGSILLGVLQSSDGLIYADLDGDGKADYLWVNRTNGNVRAYLNRGERQYNPVFDGQDIRWGTGNGAGVRFADLTGDKRADYIVLEDTGTMRVWKNLNASGNVWSWQELSNVNNNWAPPGLTSTSVIFGDVNGDGKADMAIAKGDGTLDFYIAQGDIGTSSFSWLACPNKGFWSGNPFINLVDVDGDGKADFLSIDKDGGVKGWRGKYGGGCNILWDPINNQIEKGVAIMSAPGGGGNVRLADVDGDGKADYLVIGATTSNVSLWLNNGRTEQVSQTLGGYGAGVRLADYDGDGKDDYLAIGQIGEAIAYTNGGQTSNGWTWNQQAGGAVVALGTGVKRFQVIFADINGDGRDDYLAVGIDNGDVRCWFNGGPSTWIQKGTILLGLGRDGGVGVRFADMDGDGRADYIYLDSEGAATIWLNTNTGDGVYSWTPLNGGAVSALGVGAKRADVRFADIDGDGKADYLWVHPENGAVDVWYNLFSGSGSGTTVGWLNAGQVASGVGTKGMNIAFARLGTSGRADYVAIDEASGALRVWINGCNKVIGTRVGGGNGNCGTAPLPPKTTTELGPQPTSRTAVVVITTTTNAQGTFTGTFTRNPPVTTTTTYGDESLPIYTVFPTGIQWSSTTAPSNTHDSGNRPVLAPWPPCWFCPPGSKGIVIIGGIGPGIYPGGGPPGGFPKPWPPLTIHRNGDPEYTSEEPTSTTPKTSNPTSSTTSCTSSAIRSCTRTIIKISTVYLEASTTVTSTSTTINCNTVTACSGTATTISSTTSTATSVNDVCDKNICGNRCLRRRAQPTLYQHIGRGPVSDDLYDQKAYAGNFSLSKRDIQSPGTLTDFSDFYGAIARSGSTIEFDASARYRNTDTTVDIRRFDNQPFQVLVNELVGCTTMFVVTHTGVLIAHFWDAQSLRQDSTFDSDVIKQLPYMFSDFTDYNTQDAKIFFIMGTLGLVNGDTPENRNTLFVSDPAGPRYQNRYDSMKSFLASGNVPKASNWEPQLYTYKRQIDTTVLSGNGAWGKAVVLYTNNQRVDPRSPSNNLPGNTAAWQVWMQGKLMGTEVWPFIEIQIWRVHTPKSGGGANAVNIAVQTTAFNNLEPCNGDLTPPPPVLSSLVVDVGSQITNVGTDGKKFRITDSNGNVYKTGCQFSGNQYDPQPAVNNFAGILLCDPVDPNHTSQAGFDLVSQCVHVDDKRIRTCNNVDPKNCGKLGGYCSQYYELMVRCRI